MHHKVTFVLLVVLFAHITFSRAQSLQDELDHKYKKQVLAPRAPLTHGNEEFDSAGKRLNARPAGRWLVSGGIYVEKLHLSRDRLRLEGPRVAIANEKKKDKPVLIRLSKSVRIDIHLDQPLNSPDDVRAVLDRVFFLEGNSAEHIQPEFRRSDDDTLDDEIYHASHSTFTPSSPGAPEDKQDEKDNVLPPRPTYTPEPEFSEKARHGRFQGIVVLAIVINKAGDVVRVRLVKALGMGLDQNAMEGVEHWRFTPATRDGQPVAVAMNIEVSFNLY